MAGHSKFELVITFRPMSEPNLWACHKLKNHLMQKKASRITPEERKRRKDNALFLYLDISFTLINLKTYIEHATHSVKTADSPSIPSDNPDRAKKLREEVLAEALYYSFIILLYGVVEDNLNQTCDLISETKKLPLRAKDLRGDTISQCMDFLSKLAGISADSIKSLPAIRDMAKVRNCIVHASGIIEKTNERDRNRLVELTRLYPNSISLSKVKFAHQKKLVLSFEYCQICLKAAASLFIEVFSAKRLVDKIFFEHTNHFFDKNTPRP